jgi:hypothetical protein
MTDTNKPLTAEELSSLSELCDAAESDMADDIAQQHDSAGNTHEWVAEVEIAVPALRRLISAARYQPARKEKWSDDISKSCEIACNHYFPPGSFAEREGFRLAWSVLAGEVAQLRADLEAAARSQPAPVAAKGHPAMQDWGSLLLVAKNPAGWAENPTLPAFLRAAHAALTAPVAQDQGALREGVTIPREVAERLAAEAGEWSEALPDNYVPDTAEAGAIQPEMSGGKAKFTLGDFRAVAAALRQQEQG